MKYGCIGERLAHSFSKEVHSLIAPYQYQLKEIKKEDLTNFMLGKSFSAINVTIPYKELVIPTLDWIDDHAKLIGAVNTVVNRQGKLYGYNTDFFGMTALLEHAGIDVCDKKVAILGTGGTCKTAFAVVKHLKAKTILKVSRNPKNDEIDYKALLDNHLDTQIIINTTPCGMYPNNEQTIINIENFTKLEGVLDAIYNPIKSNLVMQALDRGIKAEGGLYMLVAQGVRASEIFTDSTYPKDTIDKVYKTILCEKQNIVLIGMPSSGKSTVASIIASQLNKQVIDTDKEIESKGKKITQIFADGGEKTFRDLESQAVVEVSKNFGVIIATGGGSILRKENVNALKQNGKLYFIDRPLECLVATDDRPLSKNAQSIKKLYNERYEIYNSICDCKINANCTANEVAEKIIKDFTL